LEGLCADAWPAVVDRPLGAWRLRAAQGYTGRANAGLAIGDPGMPVPAALDEVRSFAREQAIRPRVHVPVGSPWDRAVTAQGWVLDVGHRRGAEVAVLVAPLDGTRDPRVELPERPSDAWWELGLGGPPTPAQRHVLDPGGRPRTVFAQIPGPHGSVTGTVRATVVEDHLHVSMLEVTQTARRHGLATALLASAAGWGREHGARWAVLQVALHNTGALALYERLGYVEHHQYRYLVPPPR
jgi:ribosomal protein S18 acetylase RimI-like enzyme